jgi:hypothetical protein
MAKKFKKSTLAKLAVDVAAPGVPQPVKRALMTRWGARIAFVVAVALFISGVVKVQWSDNRPHLSINHERAQEMKAAIVEEAHHLGIEKADRRDAPQQDEQPASY